MVFFAHSSSLWQNYNKNYKTDRHYITAILLKVALNTISITLYLKVSLK